MPVAGVAREDAHRSTLTASRVRVRVRVMVRDRVRVVEMIKVMRMASMKTTIKAGVRLGSLSMKVMPGIGAHV